MQIVVLGSTIVGRAFLNAGRQVVKNVQSSEGASSSSASSGQAGRASASAITRVHKMSLDEAQQILNVRDVRYGNDTALSQMLKNYETMFKQNSETTHYLQSKVVRARQRIEAEIEAERAKLGGSNTGPSAGGSAPPPS